MTDHTRSDQSLEHQLSYLVVNMEKTPLSPEVRALAEKLQTLLDERQHPNKK
ncbi:MAG: hypothetical protein P1U72_06135 [Paracoccaceae bacterium]|nr:hypothetical protein [Paracoccaceae bacterium]